MLAKKTSKNQITLPSDVLKSVAEADYFDVVAIGGEIILRPVRVVPADNSIEMVRDNIAKLGLTDQDIQDAVDWARRKK